MKISIAIAMATYNGAQYIQKQLQSFVDQTRQPDELVITDDCSTDNTLNNFLPKRIVRSSLLPKGGVTIAPAGG